MRPRTAYGVIEPLEIVEAAERERTTTFVESTPSSGPFSFIIWIASIKTSNDIVKDLPWRMQKFLSARSLRDG